LSLTAQAQVGTTLANPQTSDAAPPSSEDSRRKLFLSVFGSDRSDRTTTAAPQKLAVPLLIDGIEVALVQAKTGQDETRPLIERDSFVAAVAPLIVASLLARLTARADAQGFLSLEALKAEGLSARFDLQTLALSLDLPLPLRRVKVVNIGPEPPTLGSGGVVPPADFSSYVNVLGSLDYANAAASQRSGLQANVALDGAVNFRGTVVEGSLVYSDTAQQQFQRGDLRAVRDDPGRAVRYSAGDLSYAVAGFQSFVPMAGFSVARNFTLQPYFIPQPIGNQLFVLNQASQVEVLVNGVETRILTLPAGQYDVRNFQLGEGPNDIELRATDSLGRVTTIESPFFFSSSLLAAGVEEFSYNIGEPSFVGTSGYTYGGLPSVSAFHRFGVRDDLTVGVNFQGSIAQQQLGGEFTFASQFGTIHVDLAESHQKRAGFDDAVRLSYNLVDTRAQSSGSSLLAQATFVGPNFSPLGAVTPRNPIALDLGARYTQRIFSDIYASVGASYQFARNGEKDGHALSLTLQHAFARGLTGNLRVQQSVDRGGRSSFGALIAISWQLDDGHSFIQASYDTARDTEQASYRYSPSSYVGEPGGGINVLRSPGQDQITSSVFYNDNRFESSLTNDVVIPTSGQETETAQRTSLRAGTSLVYADGHFGLGRPIRDSFALVVPTENYADQDIIVDSSGTAGRYEARTDFLGPAVLPDLSAYQIRPTSVAIPDLPVGYQLSQDQFQLRPNYRSGTVIVVGNDATVVLDGIPEKTKGVFAVGSVVLAVEGGQ
jgi:outer membrane usher protein